MVGSTARLEHGSANEGSRAHSDDASHGDTAERSRSSVAALVRGVGRGGSRASLAGGSAAQASGESRDAGLGNGSSGAGSGTLANLNLDVAGSHNLAETAVGVLVVVLELETLDGSVGTRGGGSSEVVKLLKDELHISVRAVVGGRKRSTVSDTGGGLVLELTAGGVNGEVVAEVVAEDLGRGVLASHAGIEESDGESLARAKHRGVGSGRGLRAQTEGRSRLDLSHGEPVTEVRDVDVAESDVEDTLDVEPRLRNGDGSQVSSGEGELDLSNLVIRSVAALGRDGRAHGQEGGSEERGLGESHFESKGKNETEQRSLRRVKTG